MDDKKYTTSDIDKEVSLEKEGIAKQKADEFQSTFRGEGESPNFDASPSGASGSKSPVSGKRPSDALSSKIKGKTTKAIKNKAGAAMKSVSKKARKMAGKVAANFAKKIAASLLTTIGPYLIGGLAAIGGIAAIAYFAGLVIDNEFSRVNEANYNHKSTADLNSVMNNQMGSKGNVFFNSKTGRYELAKGKQPTQSNKLQYVYYAVMSNQSKWFVTYQRDKSVKYQPKSELKDVAAKKIKEIEGNTKLDETEKAKQIQAAVSESNLQYYKPLSIEGSNKQYTLDGKMFNLNNIDKVGLKGNDNTTATTIDNVLNEKSAKYINDLSLNVNLLYLLDSTLHGASLGTGKNQMFFGEQFIKPVYHDSNYNFKPLTEYRTKTEEEQKATSAVAHGDETDSTLEKEFQKKYKTWTQALDSQNIARGGGKSVTSKTDTSSDSSSDGISNPILKKAFDWGNSQMGKGITYSMGSRTGPTSYDCSGFVTTALNKAGFEIPPLNTVAMLQTTEWMSGDDGGIPGEGKLSFGGKKYFKQVKLDTAKKGTIIVVGGINGGGAAGHTFFLAEDFHGDSTKVLECNGGSNGINNQGTFQYASMNHLHVVAMEPIGTTSDTSSSDSSSTSTSSSSSTSDQNSHNTSGDYSEYVDTSLKNQVSTGKLTVKSREFNTEYNPEILSGLYKLEDINYNVWRENDFFINSDELSKYFDVSTFSSATGNSHFNSMGPIRTEDSDSTTKEGSAELLSDEDKLDDYSADRAELTKWSLKNGVNPAFAASLIDVLSNDSNKDLFGSQYNFLNSTDIIKEQENTSKAKAKNATELNNSIEKIIKKEMESVNTTSIGKPYWSISVKGISDEKISVDSKSSEAPERQFASSTIKVFVASSIYKKIEDKKFNESDVSADLQAMLGKADNDATNRLIDKAGGLAEINDTVKDILGSGTKTVINRKVGGKLETSTPENFTTSSDLATFMTKLDANKVMNAEHTKKMKGYLTNTSVKYKFLKSLPSGAKAITNQGEEAVRATENDSATIEYNGFKFVISATVSAQKEGEAPKTATADDLDMINSALADVAQKVTEEIGVSGDGSANYGDYGSEYYNNEFTINSMSDGLTALFEKLSEDNEGREWNEKVAKNLGLSTSQYKKVNSKYSGFGGQASDKVNIPKESGANVLKDHFYTYSGTGIDDTKALGNIQIDGKTNDLTVGNSKLYYAKNQKVKIADAASTSTNGERALVFEKDGTTPKTTTGIWDYGFGSIFKIARNEYTAYQIGMDEHGKYQLTKDSGWFENVVQGVSGDIHSTKDTEYTIIGVTTPFGTINLSENFVKDSNDFDKVIEKMKNNIDLSNADIELLEKHKEGNTITVNGESKIADEGNSFYSDKPVIDTDPQLEESQGGQYILDYLENYETYVPNTTETDIDPLQRWKAMNNINENSQTGMNKIQDIFNKIIQSDNATKTTDSTDTSSGTESTGFDKEVMKKIYDGLISRGMGTNGAMAVMVNMAHESGFRSDAVNASSGAMGLSQWLGGRAEGLKTFAQAKGKDWTDIDTQLDYLVFGETGVTHDVVVKVAQNTDKYQAVRDFYIGWEIHGGGISYVGMSEAEIKADPLTGSNGVDRIETANVDKMWKAIVGDGKVVAPDLAKLGAGTTTTSKSDAKAENADGTSIANWGDGTSFFGKVSGFLTDIKSTVMSIFGNDKNFDPTMFATDPIKPKTGIIGAQDKIYNKDGEVVNDSLIINGVDAYKWRRYSRHLSTENSLMVLRQFVASMESRDSRPVYYDEVYDTFNTYDLNRIVEEDYKYNLKKLFEKDDTTKTNTSDDSIQTASPIKGQSIEDSKVKGTAGYVKDGNKVSMIPGLQFTGDNKEVVSLKAGKVVFVGSDGDFGKTVIIRSENNTEQIAYTHLGKTSAPAVGKTVVAGDTIGETSSSGVMVVGINKNADAGDGLSKIDLPDSPSEIGGESDVYDFLNYFGIKGENQNKLLKDSNGYEPTKYSKKKPDTDDIGDTKEVKLGQYVTTTGTSSTTSGAISTSVPSGWKASEPSPSLAKYDASSYPFGQCTWFVYNRANELGVSFGKYMGNGGDWQNAVGYTVTQKPTLHSAVSFKPGEGGSSPLYGHVAFVEQVKDDGSILVSESNVSGLGILSYRTFSKEEAAKLHYVIGK